MGSQINKEIGLDLCPAEYGTKAILLITLPQGTFTNITPRLVLMARNFIFHQSDPDKLISASFLLFFPSFLSLLDSVVTKTGTDKMR